MRVLLDTGIFIWAVSSPERISGEVLRLLQDDQTVRELSTVSLVEIAIKQSSGKLSFPKDNVRIGIADLKLTILPYTMDHAFQLFTLPIHHSDPFDRQLIAQAQVENVPIITADAKFKLYKGVKIIW